MKMKTFKKKQLTIFIKLFSVSQVFPNFFMTNVQEDLRNNKSIDSGLTMSRPWIWLQIEHRSFQ